MRSSNTRELRLALREALLALEQGPTAHPAPAQATKVPHTVASAPPPDPWTPTRIIRLQAVPSGDELGLFQEYTRRDKSLKYIHLTEVEPKQDIYPTLLIHDPWHEPQPEHLEMTPEELAQIRRLEQAPWAPRWLHRVNPKGKVDLNRLLNELTLL